MIFLLFIGLDFGQSNADLLSGLGGVFSSAQTTPLPNNSAHSAVFLTANHNFSPLEATLASPGE